MKRCFLIIGFLLTNLIHGQMIINSYAYATAPIGNLYSWSDAASPTPNESNTVNFSLTDGWDDFQGLTIGTSSIEFEEGLYSIELQSISSGASDYAKLWFTVENGASYRLTFWAKSDSNGAGDCRIRQGAGFVTNPVETTFTTTWTEYSFDVTTNATSASFWFWTTRNGTLLNTMWLDNITMIRL